MPLSSIEKIDFPSAETLEEVNPGNLVILQILVQTRGRADKAPNQEINGMNAFWHSPGMNHGACHTRMLL